MIREGSETQPGCWNRHSWTHCARPRSRSRQTRHRHGLRPRASSGAPSGRGRRRARRDRARRRRAPARRCWRSGRRKASTPASRGTAAHRCWGLPFLTPKERENPRNRIDLLLPDLRLRGSKSQEDRRQTWKRRREADLASLESSIWQATGTTRAGKRERGDVKRDRSEDKRRVSSHTKERRWRRKRTSNSSQKMKNNNK